jgi:hypothetical protein
MKITLEQYGGLAGIRRRFLLDTSALGEAGGEVEGLARAVGAQPDAPGSPHPDEIGYTLVIDGEGGTREVRATGTSSSPEFGRLVEHVRKRGTAGAV